MVRTDTSSRPARSVAGTRPRDWSSIRMDSSRSDRTRLFSRKNLTLDVMFCCQAAVMNTTPGGSTMTGSPDPRHMYTRALDQPEPIIEKVEPGQLGERTPCPYYDVRALLSHMVGGLNRAATIGEGGDGLAGPR